MGELCLHSIAWVRWLAHAITNFGFKNELFSYLDMTYRLIWELRLFYFLILFISSKPIFSNIKYKRESENSGIGISRAEFHLFNPHRGGNQFPQVF